MFDGINCTLGGASKLSNAKTRSISPENRTGAKGAGGMCELADGSAREAARDLGKGWKVNPYCFIEPGETILLGEISDSGCIQHIWCTIGGGVNYRDLILRMYWDGSEIPSVECPLGDFFACGWQEYYQNNSLAVNFNPGSGMNCYWPMPFRKGCRITLENRGVKQAVIYYQIDYCLTEVSEEHGYFHAQFRRVNPLPYKSAYTIVDGIEGKGQYVGTYMCWGVNNSGWWGEGEIKFYMDGDTEYPTICGTGTEDYFCGSYDFDDPHTGEYAGFSTPYCGLQVLKGDGHYRSQQRFGLYRWHIADPIRFDQNLKVTIQALGWRSEGRYLPLQDDISSVAFWYQDGINQNLPQLPDRDSLEII